MKNKNDSLCCPVCGSENVQMRVEDRQLHFRFSGDYSFQESISVCSTCGAEGDFTNINEKALMDIKEKALKDASKNIIESLCKEGYSMAFMERSLSIPQRTMVRWKDGEVPAASVALMKFIRTYPWLLDVADADFEPQKSIMTLIGEGFKAAGVLMSNLYPGGSFVGGGILRENQGAIGIVASSKNNLTLITNAEPVQVAGG